MTATTGIKAMNSVTPTTDASAPTAPRMLGLCVMLIVLAAIEIFDSLSSVSILFGDMSEIPGPGLDGFLIKAHIATHPLLGIAALTFAAVAGCVTPS
jgi:hypothetical protein